MAVNREGVNSQEIPTGLAHLPTFQQDRWMDRFSLLSRLPDTLEEGWLLSGAIFTKFFRAGGFTGETEAADRVRTYMDELNLDMPTTRAWWYSFVDDNGKNRSWIEGVTQENWALVTVPSRATSNVRVYLCHATMDPDSGWYQFKDTNGDWETAVCVAECETIDEAESLVYGQDSYLSAHRSMQRIEQSSAQRAERKNLLTQQLDDALDF